MVRPTKAIGDDGSLMEENPVGISKIETIIKTRHIDLRHGSKQSRASTIDESRAMDQPQEFLTHKQLGN